MANSKGAAQRGRIVESDIINTGTAVGRACIWRVIEIRPISASSAESFTITANAYRKIRVSIKVSPGLSSGNPIKMRFNADSSTNYYSVGRAIQTGGPLTFPAAGKYTEMYLAVSGTAAGGQLGADLNTEFSPLVVAGVRRKVVSTAFVRENSVAADNTQMLPQVIDNIWEDASSAITSLDFLFPQAATGEIEILGLPA